MTKRRFKALAHQSARKGSKPGERVQVHGIDCEVVDDATAEQADFVVCIPAAPWLRNVDNLTGPCHDCGKQLQWRPHAPKQPPKLCRPCAMVRMENWPK
jgi:hypothetical protein